MTAAEREAWLDWLCEQDDDPFDAPQEYWDPEASAPPPGQDELTAEELAGIRQAAADELLAVEAASTAWRGPGQPGSARVFPGQSSSPAAGFGPGMRCPAARAWRPPLDAASADSFTGMSEGELVGLLCAWDRVRGARRRPQARCDRRAGPP